jgi:hypothetical protein
MDDLTRRDVLKLGAAATVAASLGVADALAAQTAPASPAFLTAAEFTLLDELSEMIIPADDHSPGARAAKVAAFIDARLAEAFEDKDKKTWRDGLTLVDDLSHTSIGKTFMEATPEQRVAVLTTMAQNEKEPKTPEALFFVELKSRVAYAYYTTEIGIKQEMEYKGNIYLAEFVGTDVSSS